MYAYIFRERETVKVFFFLRVEFTPKKTPVLSCCIWICQHVREHVLDSRNLPLRHLDFEGWGLTYLSKCFPLIPLLLPFLHHCHQTIPAKLDHLHHPLHRSERYLEVAEPTCDVARRSHGASRRPLHGSNLLLAMAKCAKLLCFCHVPKHHTLPNWRHERNHQTRARNEVTPKCWMNDPMEDSVHKHHQWIHSSCWVFEIRAAATNFASRTPHGDGSQENQRHHPPAPLDEAGRGCLLVCTCLRLMVEQKPMILDLCKGILYNKTMHHIGIVGDGFHTYPRPTCVRFSSHQETSRDTKPWRWKENKQKDSGRPTLVAPRDERFLVALFPKMHMASR